MIRVFDKLRKLLVAFIVVLVGACGTVPKEVVELSYLTGKDIQAVYVSYDAIIHQFYENMRSQRRSYLDDVWYPRFLENWREDGELVAIAKGEKILSGTGDEVKLILTPRNSDPAESLKTLNEWVNFALYAYESKETELLKSLNEEEQLLRSQVKLSFDRLSKANATITAHLNSLREVQEVQNEAMEALDMKGLREKINKGLVDASKKADDALKKVKELDSKADNLVSKINARK